VTSAGAAGATAEPAAACPARPMSGIKDKQRIGNDIFLCTNVL
jgi:hypothetical protein